MTATARKITDIDALEPSHVDELPLDSRFTLGSELTPIQKAFFDKHGFILFSQVASADEIAHLDSEIRKVQDLWLGQGRKKVFGIPLFVGKDTEGAPFIQRFAFSSVFSDFIRDFVRDERFEPVRRLVGENARVGDREKDGVVINRNLNTEGSQYKNLGWHTDGLRDLFYGRKIGPQLNVGLHFDRIKAEDGGLRIIPGTHTQNIFGSLLGKPYFINHTPDAKEVAIETQPGDLTVHDGRAWHRVEGSPHIGKRSLRRTMYVPYLTDAYQPKSEDSKTPPYHYVGLGIRKAKTLGRDLAKRFGR
jgi:phytanoyl-CoA hydroxylase